MSSRTTHIANRFSSFLIITTLCTACGAVTNADVDNADESTAQDITAGFGPGAVHPAQNAGLCLDVAGSNTANGTAVQLYACNGTAAQNWTYTNNTLRVLGNKCLDVTGGVNTSGTLLQVWDCASGNTNQNWTYNGKTLVWPSGNKCVDIPGDAVTSGKRLQIYTCNGTAAQTWVAPVATPTPVTPTSCKRGMAYGNNSVADLKALSPNVSWWYNWALAPDNSAVAAAFSSLGISFAPMVWGGSFSVNNALSVMPTANAPVLLTFNEPDFYNQANLTPEQAAALWPQITQIAKARGMKIASPGLNYCGGGCNETDPFLWFDKFFAACQGCQVDYLAVHWYACTGDALTNYLGQMEARYGRPIWLTEFACLDATDVSVPAQQAYMKTALQILEADPNVMRYAWFTGRDASQSSVNLLGADGQLTALGRQYVAAPQACKP